ncbi:MAG: right-handed parallel beta-helix repeat-containing protein [Candidatus Eisenbacteria bacterium]
MVRPLIGFGFLLLSASLALPATWHIEPNGTGDAPTIQAGIDSAAVGDTVELADGTFSGNGNRDIDLAGKALLVTAESWPPSKRGGPCVIDCEGSTGSPHRGFVFRSGEGPETLLRGVTITNGVVPDSGGAVLCIAGSSPTFESVRFIGNSSVGNGGGLYALDSSPELIDCVFLENFAWSGGGMSALRSSPVIRNTRFEENGVTLTNAGLDLQQCGGSLEGCVFYRNRGTNTGAMMVDGASNTTFTDCSFIENEAYQHVGGVYVSGSGESVFERCLFQDNRSVVVGGGIAISGATPTFRECVVTGNYARFGGGVVVAGGLAAHFFDCTFVSNTAWDAGSFLYTVDGAPLVFERIIVAFHEGGETVNCDPLGSSTFLCTDMYGNSGGDWAGCFADQNGVDGNFSADPLFCDLASNDFTLRGDSPCLSGNHPDGYDCGQIGAFGEGCGSTSIHRTSWGGVKSLFR